MKVLHFKTIDSTHICALRLADSPILNSNTPDCMVIVADEQTGGVGRCNRRWVSQKGNLFTSIIMNMPGNSDLGQLSLTVACAVRETILSVIHKHTSSTTLPEASKHFSQKLKLHWPNDVYYESSKISGTLLAISSGMLIISIGLNVNSSPNLSDRCTASISQIIKDLCFSPDPFVFSKSHNMHYLKRHTHSPVELHIRDVLDTLLQSVISWVSYLCDPGFSKVRSYWLENIYEINCDVVVKSGSSVLEGIFLGIDSSGRAVLEQRGRKLLISTGDLFVN